MQSKWLDVGMEMAAFHLQSKAYDAIRPPAFGHFPEIKSISRRRNRNNEMTASEVITQIDSVLEASLIDKLLLKKENSVRTKRSDTTQSSINSPRRNLQLLQSTTVLDGGIKTTEPSLFIQEASHLISLLSAVAFSTLRNDSENADIPLTNFEPGEPWPAVDPDALVVREEFSYGPNRFWSTILYIFGTTRTEKNRALYNMARPFRVIGGVSDGEVLLLQR